MNRLQSNTCPDSKQRHNSHPPRNPELPADRDISSGNAVRVFPGKNTARKPSRASRICLSTLGILCFFATAPLTKAQDEKIQPTVERFIPADHLDSVLKKTPAGILMPRAEFQELLEKAQAAQPEDGPAEVVIQSVSYQLTKQDQTAFVELTLQFRQFRDGWNTLAIPIGNLHPESATVDGQPAATVRSVGEPGTLLVVSEKQGTFLLKMSLSTDLVKSGTDQSVVFSVLQNTPASLTVECPAGQRILFNGRAIKRPVDLNQATSYGMPIGNTKELKLTWTSNRRQQLAENLVFAKSATVATLNRSGMHWKSETRLSVFGEKLNRLTATVPAHLEITDVRSTGLAQWTMDDLPDKDRVRLTLFYRQPFDQDRIVQIDAVSTRQLEPNEGSATSIPTLWWNQLTSHTGQIAVKTETNQRLICLPVSGVTRIASAQQSSKKSTNNADVFNFWRQNYELIVKKRARDRELFSQIQSALSIADTSLRLVADVTIETLNEPMFDCQLEVPEGWHLESLYQLENGSNQKKTELQWTQQTASSLLVHLPQPVEPDQLVQIQYVATRIIEDPSILQKVDLPVIRVVGAVPAEATFQVQNSSDLRVTFPELRGLIPISNAEERLLFEAQTSEYSGAIGIERKVARVNARAELRTWAEPDTVSTEVKLTADVVNGSTRSLVIKVPDSVDPDVRFQVQSIVQVPGQSQTLVPSSLSIVEQKALEIDGGTRPIRLTFDQRFVGSVTLAAFWETERNEDSKWRAPFALVDQATRQQGFVVFEARPTQQLKTDEDAAMNGLIPADASLVRECAPDTGRRVAMVFRFVTPDYELTAIEKILETHPVPSAICRQIRNVIVIDENQNVQRSAEIQFQSSGVQTLRFRLPEGATLWSTALNEKAVQVRRDQNDYLIAIPSDQRSTDNDAHHLQILFQMEGANPTKSSDPSVDQKSVILLVDGIDQQAAEVKILEQTWTLKFPETMSVTSFPKHFQRQSGRTTPGWLERQLQNLQTSNLPSGQSLIQRAIPVLLGLPGIFLVATLIGRRRWKTLAVLTVTVAVLASLTLGTTNHMASTSEQAGEMVDSAAAEMEPADSPMPVANEEFYIDSDRIAGQAFGGGVGSGGGGGSLGGGGFGGGGLGGGGLGGGGLGGNEPSPAQSVADVPFSNAINALPNVSNQVQSQSFDSSDDFDSRQRNSALLSIKVDVADPEHFQSSSFRSIGSEVARQKFSFQLQSASQRQALRLISMCAIGLIALLLTGHSLVFKVAAVSFVILVALGATPLLSDRWQPLVDGLLLGSLLAIGIWSFLALTKLAANCCRGPRRSQIVSLNGPTSATTAALVLFFIPLMDPALAQEQTSQPQAAATVSPQSKPAQRRADRVIPSKKTPLGPLEIIRPYQPDQPELLADQVFLPQDQFLKLYQLANPEALPSRKANQPPLVVGAFYKSTQSIKGTAGSWIQQFDARFVIQSFSSEPQSVTLPIRGITLVSSALNEQPGIVSANSKGEFQVQVTGMGPHVLDIAFQIPLNRKNQSGEWNLDLLPVATGTLTCELPEGQLRATRNGRSSGLRQNGKSVIIPISEGGPLQLTWSPAGTTQGGKTIFHADTRLALSVQDSGLSTLADISVHVRQGRLDQLSLLIPTEEAIRSIEGHNIAGWQVESTARHQRLIVSFQEPVDEKTTINLTLFRKAVIDLQPSGMKLSIPVVDGATRDSGYASVLVDQGFDIRVKQLAGIIQIDPDLAQFPKAADSTSKRVVAAFRYTRQPATIQLQIGRDTVRKSYNLISAVQLDQERQRWTSLLSATTTGAAVRELQVVLPEDYVVMDVQANGMNDWYIIDPSVESSGARRLHIQLSEARFGTVNAVIQGQKNRTSNRRLENLKGPSVSPPEAVGEYRYGSELYVWLDGVSEISSIEAADWKKIPPGRQAPIAVRKLSKAPPTVALTSDNPEASDVQLNLRQTVPSLLPESVLVTNVTDTSLELTLALKWQITRAAATDFSFTIPSVFVSSFDFKVPGLRQLSEQQEGDQTRFTIQLQRPASESLFVLGTATRPLPVDNRIVPFNVRFAIPDTAQGMITNQTHYWVLVNQSAGLLQPIDKMATPIDVNASELKTQIPQGYLDQSVSIQMCPGNRQTPAWELTFPEQEQVTATVVTLAEHQLILAEDGSWKSHHLLQLRNEGRQFLPVIVPDGADFLACRVRGQATRVLNQPASQQRALIPIPQSGQVATVFEVEFLLAGQMQLKPANLAGQPVELPLPSFPEFRNDPDYGITVARNTLKVFTPATWHVSTVENPSRTNVISAGTDELEDTRLLTVVDNLKKMMESTDASGNSIQKIQLQSQLLDQRQILQALQGNTNEVAVQRDQLIREFDAYAATNGIGTTNGQITNDPFVEVRPTEDGTSNVALQEMELRQNRFILDNNSLLYSSNAGKGIQSQSDQKEVFFNFVLPESAQKQSKISAPNETENRKQAPQKGKAKSEAPHGESSSLKRSQLMQRKTAPRAAQNQGVLPKDVDFAFQQPASPPAPGNPFVEMDQQREQLASPDFVPQTDSAGLLSLEFELPTAGNESTYIRTGGNPRLTLKVRSSERVSKSYGWIWATGCGVVFLLIISSLKTSPLRAMIRLLWLSLLISLTAALLGPSSAAPAFMLAVFIFAIVLAGIAIYGSLKSSQHSVAQTIT